MLNYDQIDARSNALALVKIALESKSIPLGGFNSAATVADAGKQDAVYLATLIQTLADKLEGK
ncbi:hypothetical protein [Pandoraea sp. SD6-2]|uniref:hypothetical protein n=1 Tax=Pandoraea sp. SD6-2 TaxID=1286093 RepID=UPI000330ACE9|nr:hypothetical protein [Pandoraea sp. SD6-2]EON13141.1 hypothetical protein C266_14054 [Pandoraea sp. SD6-2]